MKQSMSKFLFSAFAYSVPYAVNFLTIILPEIFIYLILLKIFDYK